MKTLKRELTLNRAIAIRGEFYKRDLEFNEQTICETLYDVDWRMVKALMRKMEFAYDPKYVQIGYEDSDRSAAEHNYSSIQGILYQTLEVLRKEGEMWLV